MLRCPRCAYALPYWLPRQKRLRKRKHTGLAFSKECPTCTTRTVRHRSPVWLRGIRALLGAERMSYRTCVACAWQGPAIHVRTEQLEPAAA